MGFGTAEMMRTIRQAARMKVHVHDPREVADDEVDPGVTAEVEGSGRHLRHFQDLPLSVRAVGDDPALVLEARLDGDELLVDGYGEYRSPEATNRPGPTIGGAPNPSRPRFIRSLSNEGQRNADSRNMAPGP